MSATRTRELYTRSCARARTCVYIYALARSFVFRPRPPLHPSLIHTLAAVTPTPSSLLTLPVDSCCPALSATLTRSVSVARARASQSQYTHVRIRTCVYIRNIYLHTARHSAFPLHLWSVDCGGAREGEREEGDGHERDRERPRED